MPREIQFKTTLAAGKNEESERIIEVDKPGIFCGGRLGFKIGFKYTD